MWNFKRNIFRIENSTEIVSNIYCYSVGTDVEFFTGECLGNPTNTIYETTEIMLRDINGNPVNATENYDFIFSFDERTCGSQSYLSSRIVTISAGTNSASVGYINQTQSDCGQGNCETETVIFIGVTSTPPQLPNIIDCAEMDELYPLRLSSASSPTASGVCDYTANFKTYLDPMSDFILNVNDILFLDGFKTYPFVGENRYRKLDYLIDGIVYSYVVLISDTGVILEIINCGTPPPTPYTSFQMSNSSDDLTPNTACSNQSGIDIDRYHNGELTEPIVGDTVFNDSMGLSPFNGNNMFWKYKKAGVGFGSMKINTLGVVIEVDANCPSSLPSDCYNYEVYSSTNFEIHQVTFVGCDGETSSVSVNPDSGSSFICAKSIISDDGNAPTVGPNGLC